LSEILEHLEYSAILDFVSRAPALLWLLLDLLDVFHQQSEHLFSRLYLTCLKEQLHKAKTLFASQILDESHTFLLDLIEDRLDQLIKLGSKNTMRATFLSKQNMDKGCKLLYSRASHVRILHHARKNLSKFRKAIKNLNS
jgi:hypothetical protein